MKRSLLSMMLLTPLVLIGRAQAADAPSIQIEKLAVGTAVDNRDLQGESKVIDASVPRAYCWMKVSAPTVPVTLKQVWYADGQKEADVPLEIKSSPTRSWSSKSIWPAKWKVDVTDSSGQVLASTDFTVKAAR